MDFVHREAVSVGGLEREEGEQGLRVQIDGLSEGSRYGWRKAVATPTRQDIDAGDLACGVSWKGYGIMIIAPRLYREEKTVGWPGRPLYEM